VGKVTRKTTNKKAGRKARPRTDVEQVQLRDIKGSTRLTLYVRAGGRCEFDGCNDYLLRHPLTLHEGNFGQMAHIVAFKADGPRGKAGLRPEYINDADNLMLLCPPCHKLIDERPEEYSRQTLEKYKRDHEQRIFNLTATKPDRKTTIVQLMSRIAGQTVAIPAADVRQAVSPRYPDDPRGFVINLTSMRVEDKGFLQAAASTISAEVQRLYAPGMEVESTRHISLFALAPIPLLIYLGRELSNKVPVDPYQRHRDTEDWAWKPNGTPVGYTFRRVREGSDPKRVAFVLSLSGTVNTNELPKEIDGRFSVYEITLGSGTPNPTFLRLKDDVTRFRTIYQEALRTIATNHPALQEIHFFPAVPAPIAVLCGRELLPKVDPTLIVYDHDKRQGGFQPTLRIN
jgi:SMODS-associated and fused to various effectors sensor domain